MVGITNQFKCISCASQGTQWFSKGNRSFWRCQKCSFVWISQGVVQDDLGKSIYEQENPVFLRDGNEAYYLDETNLKSATDKCIWIKKFLSSGASVLDVGANFGHFAHVCRNQFEIRAVEISPTTVKWALDNFSLSIKEGSIYDLTKLFNMKFSAVTCWDVIEHIDDPELGLRQMWEVLEPGGKLFISTPDMGAFLARIMGKYWHYLDITQHIALFNRGNLSQMLERHGFEVVEFTSFGHYYRIGYIMDRLSTIHANNWLRFPIRILEFGLRPFSKFIMRLQLGDVMGVVARKL